MAIRVVLALSLALAGCSGDEPPDPAAPGSTSTAAPAAPVVLRLPADLAAAREAADLRVVATSFQTMRLTVSNPRRAARITLPVGLRFVPSRPGVGAPHALAEPFAFDVVPGARETRHDLSVVNLDPAIWRDPAKDDPPHEIGSTLPDGLLEHFLAAGRERGFGWALLQTGAWIVEFDVEGEVYRRNRVATTHLFMPEASSASSLADWSGIRKVDRLLVELGARSERYRLVKETRQELADFLARLDLERPHVNATTVLANLGAVEYAGEPEVEAILVRWATEHPEEHVRQDAVRNLVKIGLSGDREGLLSTLTSTPHREVRFLAALALRRAGDRRGIPVLAELVAQPFFREILPGWTNEIEAWRKAPDWTRLEAESGDAAGVRALVLRMAEEGDPIFLGLLETTRGGDAKEIGKAIDQLARRYASRPESFEALSRLALEHPDRPVRIQAFDALRMTFARSFDVRSLARRILTDPDVEFVRDSISRVASTNLAWKDEHLLEAAGHAEPEIRLAALHQLEPKAIPAGLLEVRLADADPRVRRAALRFLSKGRAALPEDRAVELLRERAGGEADDDLRWEAARLLHERRSPHYLPLARGWLESGSDGRKRMVVSNLVDWKGDAAALDLLAAFRTDPVVGKRIDAHLKACGR